MKYFDLITRKILTKELASILHNHTSADIDAFLVGTEACLSQYREGQERASKPDPIIRKSLELQGRIARNLRKVERDLRSVPRDSLVWIATKYALPGGRSDGPFDNAELLALTREASKIMVSIGRLATAFENEKPKRHKRPTKVSEGRPVNEKLFAMAVGIAIHFSKCFGSPSDAEGGVFSQTIDACLGHAGLDVKFGRKRLGQVIEASADFMNLSGVDLLPAKRGRKPRRY